MNRIHTARGVLGYATMPLLKQLRNWWLRKLEAHYLICADVEAARAKEALENQAHYQRQAAIARSSRI